MPPRTRVLLVNDYPLVRKGERTVLEDESDIEVVGECECGDTDEILTLCMEHDPNVLILGVTRDNVVPVGLLNEFRQKDPGRHILLVVADNVADQVEIALAAGAAGYLLKSEAESLLPDAVRAVRQGGAWISPSASTSLRPEGTAPPPRLQFSERQRQVLYLLAQGKDNHAIADELHLAEQTIRNYISQIYDKLQLHSRAEAIVWAIEHGFGE